MRTSTASSADGTRPTRVIIIDDQEIFRAACRALLRAEGIDVIADLRASDQALTAARTLLPDVAIVDVTPTAEAGFGIADRLRALPAPPAIILTSSTERTQLGARLNGLRFIAKADLCAAAIARLTTTPDEGGPESPDPGTPAKHPSQGNE